MVRVYVDGEASPSINITLLEMANVGLWTGGQSGAAGDGGPWGVGMFGHTAQSGGVYSTWRIPFGKSVRTTIENGGAASGTFWFIVRGIEAYPVQLGDLTLPASARLKLYRFNKVTQPNELVTLATVPAGTAGALLNVKFDAQGRGGETGLGFLEACMRAQIDGASQPIFLSSGAEDYFLRFVPSHPDPRECMMPFPLFFFGMNRRRVGGQRLMQEEPLLPGVNVTRSRQRQPPSNLRKGACARGPARVAWLTCPLLAPSLCTGSAYYFNEGQFKTSQSGMTYKDHGMVSAYKVHDRDPILFNNGLNLIFRNGEVTHGCGDMQTCPSMFCRNNRSTAMPSRDSPVPPPGLRADASNATYHALVWVYEWPKSASDADADATPSTRANRDTTAALELVGKLGASKLITLDEEDALVDRLSQRDEKLAVLMSGLAGWDLARAARQVRRAL